MSFSLQLRQTTKDLHRLESVWVLALANAQYNLYSADLVLLLKQMRELTKMEAEHSSIDHKNI